MGVIWHKVWFDLWHNKSRTLLAVLSIAAGVFLVGFAFGMADQLLSGMDRAHQSVFPSHIQLYLTKPVDRDTILALRHVDGVDDVEPQNGVAARYKVHPEDKWKTAYVTMRDDYKKQKYDVVQLKQGPWPSGTDLDIERLAAQYLKLDVGDQIILEVDKKERSFPLVGKIRHPFVPPPDFGGPPYFFADAEGFERFGVPQGQFQQILVRVKPWSTEHAREVASAIKDRLGKQGIGVGATLYQDPNKHWGRVFVEGITIVLQVLAVISLLMSVVLVLNTVTAIVTQQTNQIGVLKAVGGRSGTIVRIYLTGVLVYGLLALLIALPLGLALAYAVTSWFLNLFNIDYNTFAFSRQAVWLMVGAALVVPVLAALWPVLRAAAITVREAIASYGLGGDFGSNWFDRGVEAVGQRLMPSHYAMALANTFRRKGRLALTLLVLVMAGCLFLMVMSLSSSITATLDAEFSRRAYDIQLNFREPQRIDRASETAESVDGVSGAALWFAQPVTVLRKGQKLKEAGLGTDLNGVDIKANVYRPPIVAGRWLQPGDTRAIVMSQDAAKDNKIQLGDTITLNMGDLGKADWQVVGLYKVVFGGGFATDTIYAPLDAVLDAAKKGPRGGQVYVRLEPSRVADAEALAVELEDTYRGRNMPVEISQTMKQQRTSAESQFNIFVGMLLAIAIIVAVVGGIGLMGALSISVIERTKEIGVLRAIGARSPTILRMFMLEGLVTGLISWAIAVPLAAIISPVLAGTLGRTMFSAELDYRYNATAAVAWLAVILVISILASILPARSATRVSVRQSLQYE
jgi:putative ABC transport system permease protein